ncbi:hypothetical protein BVC93_04460 [Mycobacterium sp. MS1601]|uniref:GGDEF domain-containing protein n=1 Tax=Mycobacterium sp. MS1601 TaxID=1936029 RepID=UPI0009794174|nr:GGDEF domain-containing protein [Mycobacterium sp. MS1601]AQA01814.1 hypothetical protein BVC93_04460 [Mycobacterium sp. MS1601]
MLLTTAQEAPATALYNRSGLFAGVERFAGAQKPAIVVAAVVNLDRFAELNDNHGREHGNRVLQAVAKALQSCVRAGEVVSRTGGDEFVVLASLRNAKDVADLIRRLEHSAGSVADVVTASVGVAWQYCHCGCDAETLESVLDMADTAMRGAKREGGDRICFHAVWPAT